MRGAARNGNIAILHFVARGACACLMPTLRCLLTV
jgi:hypothetical protein